MVEHLVLLKNLLYNFWTLGQGPCMTCATRRGVPTEDRAPTATSHLSVEATIGGGWTHSASRLALLEWDSLLGICPRDCGSEAVAVSQQLGNEVQQNWCTSSLRD